jgi:hypothetical protein
MEPETRTIVAIGIEDKRNVALKSVNMEKKALAGIMNSLKTEGIVVKELATDAHTQIKSLLSKFCYFTRIHSV